MSFEHPVPALSYCIITAARNEEAYIEGTVRSVIAQKILPVRWIIVSDGSTDQTDAIVERYAKTHGWITFIKQPHRAQRHFAAKAHAVNAAYATLKDLTFDIVANLDADVTFDADYFGFVLQRFSDLPLLGVAGTPYVEGEGRDAPHSCAHAHADLQHVSGPCQVFRRSCFEAIGGYVPIKGGAIDWIAVRTARMKGWTTRTFLGKTYRHHRKMGTAEQGILASCFHYGRKAYSVGGLPAWEILRGFFQMRKEPWIIGGLMFQLGFIWAMVIRQHRPVSPELLKFHRSEQMNRLRGIFRLGRRPSATNPPSD